MKNFLIILLGLISSTNSYGQGFEVTVSPKVGDPDVLIFNLNSEIDYLGPVDNQWQGWQLVIAWEISGSLPCNSTLVPTIQSLDGLPAWTKIPNPVPQDGFCYLEFNKAGFQQSYNSNSPQDIFEITLAGNLTYNDLIFPLVGNLPATAGPGLPNILGDQFLGYDLTALPITLSEFKAAWNSSGWVDLKWTTVSEIGSDKFLVERSKDGRKWETIGTESARGAQDIRMDYFLKDHNPHTGINYYRLKMFDLDGSFKYSPIAAVMVENEGIHAKLYPNPASDFAMIDVEAGLYLEEITLYNLQGKLIKHQTFTVASQYRIELSELAHGEYFMEILLSDKQIFTKKLILTGTRN